ncbi:hypothetical protein BDW22DRAFT_1039207 [Trametopsis cervina]|nr:hypothetical protein BDW22DRAFT_1039207 [Trametopsis cervina]
MYSTLKSAIRWTNTSIPTMSDKDLCDNCGKKPKFIEHGFQHPYCGKTCARNGSTPKAPCCVVAGCLRTAKAAYGGCCCDEHFKEALRKGQVEACAQCHNMPQTIGQLCTPCERQRRAQPTLRELKRSDVIFSSLLTQFTHEWQGTQPPEIHKIIEIVPPRDAKSRFEGHRRKVDATKKLLDLRTYHADQCICDFGVDDTVLCSWQSCGICSIIKSSFTSFAFGVKHNDGRYGGGVYSYVDPARADKFATSSTSSPYRATIACDVAASTRNNSEQVVDDGRVFVADPAAILPAYVILYSF